MSEDSCVIEGTVDGLCPGEEGLAIHETGDTSRDCASLGNHYNRRGIRHGSPVNGRGDRHVGDLGNVAEYDGRAMFIVQASRPPGEGVRCDWKVRGGCIRCRRLWAG